MPMGVSLACGFKECPMVSFGLIRSGELIRLEEHFGATAIRLHQSGWQRCQKVHREQFRPASPLPPLLVSREKRRR